MSIRRPSKSCRVPTQPGLASAHSHRQVSPPGLAASLGTPQAHTPHQDTHRWCLPFTPVDHRWGIPPCPGGMPGLAGMPPSSAAAADRARSIASSMAQFSADQARLSMSAASQGARQPPSRSTSPNKSRLEGLVSSELASSGAAVAAVPNRDELQSLYSRLEAQRASAYLPGRARFTPVAGYRGGYGAPGPFMHR